MIIHSFLMVGQSNMAGRGSLNEVEPISAPALLMLHNGRWRPMRAPVTPPDRDAAFRSELEKL